MRSLVPLRKSTAVAPLAQSGAGVVLAGTTPPIALALTKVLVAFASPAQGDLDMQLVFSVYCEAIEEIPESVVLYARKRLQTKNPRNPFRPSPQDVYEACQARLKELRRAVLDYLGNGNASPWPALLGGPPFQHDCVVPPSVALEAAKSVIDDYRQWRNNDDDAVGEVARIADRLHDLPQSRFDVIPIEAFGSAEEHAAVVGERDRLNRRAATWGEYVTRVQKLGHDLCCHRREVMDRNAAWWDYRDRVGWRRGSIPTPEVEDAIMRAARWSHRREMALANAIAAYEREHHSGAWRWISDPKRREYIEKAFADLGCTPHGELLSEVCEDHLWSGTEVTP